jgi:hypothetical protein
MRILDSTVKVTRLEEVGVRLLRTTAPFAWWRHPATATRS